LTLTQSRNTSHLGFVHNRIIISRNLVENKKMKHDLGFTMLEALIVIAIMAMVTISVPAFYAWFKGQGAGLAADQLRADLQQARIMAVNQRRTCALEFHMPNVNQYTNTLNQRVTFLSGYHGGVRFLNKGPDGAAMAPQIAFNSQGMSTSAGARFVFLADEEGQAIYRVRVLGPGGIQVGRWSGGDWR
jgi:Tfp pilus assembly protein FimT